MKVAFMLAADAASATLDDKVSLLGGDVEVIRVEKVPTLLPSLSIVARVDLDGDEANAPHKVELEFADADDEGAGPIQHMVGTMRGELHPITGRSAIRMIVNLQNTRLSKYGQYSCRLLIDGTEIESIPLFVAEKEKTKND